MAKPTTASSISWMLFHHLRNMYETGVADLKSQQILPRVKLNGFHPYGLSVFPLAVASWEAFLNEKCMSLSTELDYPDSILWEIREKADKWETMLKARLVPKLLLGQTFSKSSQPYQDFLLLVDIRNHIAHFRLEEAPLKSLKQLAQRKITHIPPRDIEYAWPMYLQSTEVMRWTINTVSQMAQTLDAYFPSGRRHGTSVIFEGINEAQAKDLFIKLGIDPEVVEEARRNNPDT